jgi:hypothetical protein
MYPVCPTMTTINLNLKNFSHSDMLLKVFSDYSDGYEYTTDEIFRKAEPPICPDCDIRMVNNGYNIHCKDHLGRVKVGRYLCPSCRKSLEEDFSFWEEIKSNFFEALIKICQILRHNHASLEEIELLLAYIYPRDGDTIQNWIKNSVQEIVIPKPEKIQIVHYDEQHPKSGRNQKYRLTLLDGITRKPIADEIYDSKDSDTVKAFLRKHLNPEQAIFIVTDLFKSYPNILHEVFGNRAIHQFCLFHLNKLIVNDFPRVATIDQELTKYKLLNIFYNRELEIKFLSRMAEDEKAILRKSKECYKDWLKKTRYLFSQFLHNLELKRRRNEENLKQRSYCSAVINFNNLMAEFNSFEVSVRRRLLKIKEYWNNLTAFCFVDDAPATNNAIENYYSTSLKTQRKSQLREPGLEIQMKLSAMKREGFFGKPKMTLLEAFYMFIPFIDWK